MAFHKTEHTGIRAFFAGLLILGFFACQQDQFREAQLPDHLLWPRPGIIPVPAEVSGVPEPVVSLNGTWKFSADPPENFWLDEVDFGGWHDIRVPAQASFHIEGLSIRRNAPRPSYVYKRIVEIPEEYAGKRVRLRFQGVTGDATVWVNGTEVGSHHGGFTIWNPDITEQVTPGEEAVVTVSVHEPASGQSTNTYNGGIIRSVELMALPENHITRFHIDTDLDSRYRNALMNVWIAMAFGEGTDNVEVHLTLRDPDGEFSEITPSVLELSSDETERIFSIPVDNPMKWSAEHPHLYTIRADLHIDGSVAQSVERRIGFREVEIDGQRVLVNGNEIKLRGSAQFDSHPLNGISLTREEVIRDLTLYKEANHNHVRPANYIANEDFLSAADSIGMYISGEMPVTFAAVAARNEFLLPIFMNQTAETIEQARNHPSILFWTLANETTYGFNIGKMAEYVFAEEPGRPVVFSWPQTIPHDEPLPYNIYSFHYPNYDDDVGRPGIAVFNSRGTGREIPPMPVLADEFAHPASYNYEEMRRDPNVRNFWGKTIKIFRERMFTTHGSLGGALFAGIDHPRSLTSEFPWGLLDKWRRPKPEYWHTKKAYSPVRLDERALPNPGTGSPLELPVRNWFDHTNLDEVTFFWSVAGESGQLPGPDVAPRGSNVPVETELVEVEVAFTVRVDGEGLLTTEYRIPDFPLEAPETRVVPWNRTNAGGYSEVGVSYLLTDSTDYLEWEREGLWSVYPETHIGRNEGVAPRTTETEKQVGIEPEWPWSLDEKDFGLFGPDDPGGRGTNDFRSMKENIYHATAFSSRSGVGLRAESDGTHAVRLEVVRAGTGADVWMNINNEWNYRHLGLGNFMKPPIIIQSGYSDNVYVRFVEIHSLYASRPLGYDVESTKLE